MAEVMVTVDEFVAATVVNLAEFMLDEKATRGELEPEHRTGSEWMWRFMCEGCEGEKERRP